MNYFANKDLERRREDVDRMMLEREIRRDLWFERLLVEGTYPRKKGKILVHGIETEQPK